MLILQEEKVQICKFKLADSEAHLCGFFYLNRLFMQKYFLPTTDFKTAVRQARSLLDDDHFAVILQRSDVYSIWSLAPATARIVPNPDQIIFPEKTVSVKIKTRMVRGISYLQYVSNYEDSIGRAKRFLNQGKKVKFLFDCMGKHQGDLAPDLSKKLLNRTLESLKDSGKVKQEPKVEGSTLTIEFFPKKTPQSLKTIPNFPQTENFQAA